MLSASLIILGLLACLGVGGPYYALGFGDIDAPSNMQNTVAGILMITCGLYFCSCKDVSE